MAKRFRVLAKKDSILKLASGGVIRAGHEAILSEEEYEAWGPTFFAHVEEIDEPESGERTVTDVPGRMDRMTRGGRTRGTDAGG
jgi:hypothetical protein